MAKRPNKVARKRTVRSRAGARQVVVRQVPRGVNLDKAALDYAKLLTDPCNGPLVTGPFGDGGGGIVSRFESDFLVDAGGTETGAFYAFVPGTNTAFGTSIPIANDATAFSPVFVAGFTPGYTFLSANASQFRCLSACVQVYWPGTEFNRSGVISLTNAPAGLVSSTSVLSTATLRATSEYVERTPVTVSEIVWRPNNYDLTWIEPQTELAANFDKHNALIVSGAGMAIGNGLRCRVVGVYEWMPLTGNGIVQSQNRGQQSSNTFQDVIQYVDKFGDWMYHGALDVAHAASSLYSGFKAVSHVAYGTAKMAAMFSG
jgi:hypothetical protein